MDVERSNKQIRKHFEEHYYLVLISYLMPQLQVWQVLLEFLRSWTEKDT